MKVGNNELEPELNEYTVLTLERIFDGMPGGFFIYCADGDGELLYNNKALLRVFGCIDNEEFRQLTGNTFRGMVHQDDYDEVQKSIFNQIECSVYDLDYVEYRITRRDGSVRWVEDYGHFVHSAVYGDVFYVFVEDATERLTSRMQELERVNNRLRNIHTREVQYRKAILNDAVTFFEVNLSRNSFMKDTSQLVDGKNTNLFEGLGVQPFERYTDFIQHWVTNAERKKHKEIENFFDSSRLIQCFNKGQLEQSFDGWITDSQGRKRLTHHTFLLGRNEYTGDIIALCIIKDITEQAERQSLLRKAIQQAETANMAKEAFLTNISHDIRTPLNAIIGYAKLVKKHMAEADKADKYINKIMFSGEQLLAILNNSLEITRIESGRAVLKEVKCSLRTLISDVEKSIQLQVDLKSVEFTAVQPKFYHDMVAADYTHLKEVLNQLLDNAVKYTPSGGKVTLTVEETDIHLKGYGEYRFIVEDDGIGISEEFIGQLFELFSREKNTTQSGIAGAGLGLVVVKSLVDMMEGQITVESKPGEGSKFTVAVLLKHEEEEAQRGSADTSVVKETASVEEVRILLVEDNEINREIAEELLRDRGYLVDSAENGSRGVELLKASKPGFYSVVLMDIMMPVMDGYEASRAIRQLENQTHAQIPIVALSANVFPEDYQKSQDAGMNAHVAKPVDIEQLDQVIKELLSEKMNASDDASEEE